MGGIDSFAKLVVHCDGADASTSFSDQSSSAHTVTAGGNAQVDTAQSKFGGASVLLAAVGDFLGVSGTADFDFGSGDFTIDWWERRTGGAGGYTPICRYQGYATTPNTPLAPWLVYNGLVYISSDEVNWDIANGQALGSVADSTWYHKAIVRSGNTFYTFSDGVQQATWTSSLSIKAATTNNVDIGKGDAGNAYFFGHIDEVRISKGIARWTAGFTPPTAPYGLEADGALTPSGALTRAVGKSLAGALTPVGAAVKAVASFLAGSLTPSGSPVWGFSRTFAGSITPAGSAVWAVAKSLAGSITPTSVIGWFRGIGLTTTTSGSLTLTAASAGSLTLTTTTSGSLTLTAAEDGT